MNELLRQLKRFLLERGKSCIHQPEGKLNDVYVTPTAGVAPGADDDAVLPARSGVGHYLQMYDWDACFFSQMGSRLGVPDLGVAVVRNFLGIIEDDGHVPRTVSPFRLWDRGDHCKPFLAQTLLSQVKAGVSVPDLQDLFRALEVYLAYFDGHRRDASGLYHWRNVLESGVDDNLALLAPFEAAKDDNEKVGAFPDGRILAVDLNTYLASEFLAMEQLALSLHMRATAERYGSLGKELAGLIESKLWSDTAGMYLNLDPASGRFVAIKAWTGLAPFLFGLSSKEHLEKLVEGNLMNEKEFLCPYGLSSLSRSEPLFNQSRRGLYGRVIVSNWQGPMWVLPNALAVRALLHAGLPEMARHLATRVLQALALDIQSTGTVHENYNAENAQALWAPDFISWNILALEMIDHLE